MIDNGIINPLLMIIMDYLFIKISLMEATMHPHVYKVQISLILDLKAHFTQRLESTFK